MSEEDLKKSVKINLRGVTQSRKGGVPLNQLQNDYKDFIGRDIPLKDLGYSSLEYFLRDIPDVISLKRNKDGVVVAEGVADASTAHIAKLISKQKTSKSASTKPAVLFRKKGNTLKTAKENQKSSHAKLKNLPVKTEGEFPEQCSKPGGQLNPENHGLKKSVLIHLKSVVQSCKGGVPLNRLDKDYRAFIGKNIPFKELGYDSLENFIRSVPDVISLKKNAKDEIIALGVSDSSTAHLFGQKTKRESSKLSEALDSAKNLPADSTVIRISTQKNAKLPSFFQLPQNASETALKNGLKISSNGNSFNHDICQSVDSNAQPSLSKIPQKKENKNNTESSAVIHSEPISSTANSKMNNSNAGASEMRNKYPSNLNLKQNTTMNLSNQNLDSTLLNGDSTCNLKHQLKDGNIPDSETVSEGKVNRMNGIHSNSSDSSFDESTQKLNNVLIPTLVQAFSAVPEKLNTASKMSFRSSSADLDCIEPSAIDTSIVSKRASRRVRKRIKDISNTLKIEDNTLKDAERSNSQAALHSSQDRLTNTGASNSPCNAPESTYPRNGLTNTGAFNYPCNAPESIYPKFAVSSGVSNANLNVILQLHFILFGPPCLEVLRNDILSFTGFPFSKDSEEWKRKANFLSKLSKRPLKEFLTFLGIPCSTKEKKTELVNKLLVGLEAYTMPGRFCQ
ncbi:uncharacterized protein TNIN_413721 [Trichonephila inaurata madagascariensis]|uniref:HTH OST-type domain-containing protein n=1 Tax=Trichonephila inaurata madagascariensis TaxID=2747483 RepID=A0A8X7C429_9ARAC|nr:uncharacterized protein TNIN_413721 [Trichonephila inaurata madagascariensis]